MSARHAVVVGAGFVGAVSAIELLRAGLRVTIVEPAEPGGEQAASYGNAGWLSSHSVIPPATPGAWRQAPGWLRDPLGPLAIRWRHLPRLAPWLVRYLLAGGTEAKLARTARALRSLLREAPALHALLAAEAGVPHLIVQGGVLHAWPTRQDFEAESLAWRIRADVDVRWAELDAEALRRHEPDLSTDYRFAVRVDEAGHCIDPGAYAAALAAHAQARGARWVRARATGLRIEAGRLRAVRTEAGEIGCDAAAICAGAHSAALAAAAGDRVPLESERGYHAMVAAPEAGPRTPTMFMDRKMVATRTPAGLRAAGQVEFASLRAAPDWRRAEALREHLLQLYPGLARPLPDARVRTWMGHRPSLPDGLACIGKARATPDVVHAFGHGHVGLAGSARTGRLVAQLLAGIAPEIDLAPFDAGRFRRWRQAAQPEDQP